MPKLDRILSLLLAASCALAVPAFTVGAFAMIMQYPKTIRELEKSSDLVVKAKVLSVEPAPPALVKDSPLMKGNEWFKLYRAKIQISSTLKGDFKPESPNSPVYFIYRSANEILPFKPMIDVGPDCVIHFNLESGRTYLLFAKKNSGDTLAQAILRYSMRTWEGFFLVSGKDLARPASLSTLTNEVWRELTLLLKSENNNDVRYAISTLLSLSQGTQGGGEGSSDFTRKMVLAEIFELVSPTALEAIVSDKASLKELLKSVNLSSPYTSNDRLLPYLWTKTKQPVHSWAPWKNSESAQFASAVPFLLKVANGHAGDSESRALAVRALGGAQADTQTSTLIKAELPRWLKSTDMHIKAAAVLLSSDYPGLLNSAERVQLLSDKSAEVRKAAAYSAGILQCDACISQLDKMLKDPDAHVQAAAALSLMSFPISKTREILLANGKNDSFGTGFLARLAASEPAPYAPLLLAECRKKTSVLNARTMTPQRIDFQNGLATDPHEYCKTELLKYLDSLSGVELKKPEFKEYLKCMEEKAVTERWSIGAVYQMLRSHSLNERAASFKKLAMEKQVAQAELDFDRVEKELQMGVIPMK